MSFINLLYLTIGVLAILVVRDLMTIRRLAKEYHASISLERTDRSTTRTNNEQQ